MVNSRRGLRVSNFFFLYNISFSFDDGDFMTVEECFYVYFDMFYSFVLTLN